MASDHDAFADWMKTLGPADIARLRAVHSASAQTAADTAVQDDPRPSADNPYGLSPRSLLIYANQEAWYHAQEGCYTGPIPACFDYVPPQDMDDLADAHIAEPSQPSTAPTAQVTAADTAEEPLEPEPVPDEGEFLHMEEPSASTPSAAFQAQEQSVLYTMMGAEVDMTAVVTAASHQQPFPLRFFDSDAQTKPLNRHELWQLIRRPDLGVARKEGAYLPAEKFVLSPPPNFFPHFFCAPVGSSADASPMAQAKADPPLIKAVPPHSKPPSQQIFLPEAGTKAIPQPQPSPPPPKPQQPVQPQRETPAPSAIPAATPQPSQEPASSLSPGRPQPFTAKFVRMCSSSQSLCLQSTSPSTPGRIAHRSLSDLPFTVEPPPQPAKPSADASSQEEEEPSGADTQVYPPCQPLPEFFSADSGVLRYWHQGAVGSNNPRNMGNQSVPTMCPQDIGSPPEALMDRRKGLTIHPPSTPYPYRPPALALPRLPCSNMRNCIIVPSLTLPHTYELDPAFARMYYMGNRGEMRCGIPCSTVPFCPYHSACGRELNKGTVEHEDKHSGHQCSRCKEFTDLGRSPFEWFSAVPPQAALKR
ncbi:unnamed protein product [Symbiodinium sp. CCMP2592]|nr:unnamed protein product [Symbiodinium sp. CCMP2592]